MELQSVSAENSNKLKAVVREKKVNIDNIISIVEKNNMFYCFYKG